MSAPKEKSPGEKLVARNRKALHDYHVAETYEAGLVLTGTEVKSLRDGKLQLMDSYALVQGSEVFLVHMHIGEYKNGSFYNHVPTRARKLLLHKGEIEKLTRRVEEKGYTLIPLEIYFKGGYAKVKLGVCKGKTDYDKRATIKAKDEARAARRGE